MENRVSFLEREATRSQVILNKSVEDKINRRKSSAISWLRTRTVAAAHFLCAHYCTFYNIESRTTRSNIYFWNTSENDSEFENFFTCRKFTSIKKEGNGLGPVRVTPFLIRRYDWYGATMKKMAKSATTVDGNSIFSQFFPSLHGILFFFTHFPGHMHSICVSVWIQNWRGLVPKTSHWS